MSYILSQSGLTLKITDTLTSQVQYLQQPNVTLTPAQVGGNPIDTVTFKSGTQILTLQVKNISQINGAAPADTLDGITDQIMDLLANTLAAPALSGSGHINTQTSNTDGNVYICFPDTPCIRLILVNTTGADLDIVQGQSTDRITILDGRDFTFQGIYNANVIQVRRNDRTTAQVTVNARWES